MRRGTTQPLTFNLPFDASLVSALYITFTQDGETVFEKTISDVTINGTAVSCSLTQENTLSLRSGMYVFIQIRAKFVNGAAPASQKLSEYVEDISKDGVI